MAWIAIAVQLRNDGSWVLTGRERDGAPSVPLAHGRLEREAGRLRCASFEVAPALAVEEAAGRVSADGVAHVLTAARYLGLMFDALEGVNAPQSAWEARSRKVGGG